MDVTTLLDDNYPYYLKRSPEHGGWKVTKMCKITPWRVTNAKINPYSPYLV